jgi:hypothetical protein
VNVERMQRNVNDLNKLGVLKAKLVVKNYVDSSIVDEAAKRAKQ